MGTNLKPNNKQQLATNKKAVRMRNIRIGGIVVIIMLFIGGVYIWRTSGQPSQEEAQPEFTPNIDGDPNAPVRIVEFADFGCSSCRAWHNAGVKEALQATYGDQIAFEFRHLPIITRQSPMAAEASQCAAEQDQFWAYHDYIYEQTQQEALSAENLKSYAAAIGLNQSQFDECLDNRKYQPHIRHDWNAAHQAGARGTPTFLINGQRVDPYYENLAAVIEQSLAE